MMAERLSVQNLVKRYDSVEAVRGVSFSVGGGEIFGLLGPNGAGKTTTIECAVGLRSPDAGAIVINGIDMVKHPERARASVGVALQSTSLQDKITPREALRLFGSFYPNPVSPETLLGRFGLAEKADASFMTLSHGQRQRLALALAFVNQPDLIFLDEPTTGLDPQSRRDLHQLIRSLRDEGRTVILTTHYIEEAQNLADRVAIIDHGRIIATGKPSEMIARAGAKSLEDVFIQLTGTALRE